MFNAMKKLTLPMIAAAVVALMGSASAGVNVDDSIPTYSKTSGVSGNLNSVGSDTLNNLMTLWAESFQKLYPNVQIQIEGKGSSTAPPALIEGTSQLGPMSRRMKSKELDAFEKKFGYKPTPFGVAIDCLAVYVNKDNPLNGISLPQVDAIFSKTRKHGHGEDITTWGQLGLTGEWENLPISIYGRNSASGTYGFFRKVALGKGDYKDSVKEQPGSAAVVNGVTKDKGGIGYSGIGYRSPGVKVLAVSKEGEDHIPATFENAVKDGDGQYPLARVLFVYTNKEPNKPLPTLINEFFKFVLSQQGQKIVIKDGYGPLPGALVEQQLKMLK